ncbi:hypothetical protein C8J56DRAFT_881055 [Mycena floridula]|nr:hypothetical protein C8J56DRAFT_881055 [Mycena floridula]
MDGHGHGITKSDTTKSSEFRLDLVQFCGLFQNLADILQTMNKSGHHSAGGDQIRHKFRKQRANLGIFCSDYPNLAHTVERPYYTVKCRGGIRRDPAPSGNCDTK